MRSLSVVFYKFSAWGIASKDNKNQEKGRATFPKMFRIYRKINSELMASPKSSSFDLCRAKVRTQALPVTFITTVDLAQYFSDLLTFDYPLKFDWPWPWLTFDWLLTFLIFFLWITVFISIFVLSYSQILLTK